MSNSLLYEEKSAVAVLTINDAPYNRMSLDFMDELEAKVEEIARENNCCKLTLEVLSANYSAKRSYENFGFSAYELNPSMGQALFWQKHL